MHSEPVLMTLGQTDLPLSVSGTSQCLINPYLRINQAFRFLKNLIEILKFLLF